MNIKERYSPYNFSSTKCHVIQVPFQKIIGVGIIGIEQKLPAHIGILKGIYLTCDIPSAALNVGGAILTLNEGLLKNFQMILYNTKLLKDASHPIPLNEEILTNSIMQGFCAIYGPDDVTPVAGKLSIYLHYEERK